LNECLLRLG